MSVAAVIQKDGERVKSGNMIFGGIAPIPWSDKSTAIKLKKLLLNPETFDDVAQHALSDAEPLEQNEYKLVLAKNLIKQLLMRLTQ